MNIGQSAQKIVKHVTNHIATSSNAQTTSKNDAANPNKLVNARKKRRNTVSHGSASSSRNTTSRSTKHIKKDKGVIGKSKKTTKHETIHGDKGIVAKSKKRTKHEAAHGDKGLAAESKKPSKHEATHGHSAKPKSGHRDNAAQAGSHKAQKRHKTTKPKLLMNAKANLSKVPSVRDNHKVTRTAVANQIGIVYGVEAKKNFENSDVYKDNDVLTAGELLKLIEIYDSTAALISKGAIPTYGKIVDQAMGKTYDLDNPKDLKHVLYKFQNTLNQTTKINLKLDDVFAKYESLRDSDPDQAKVDLYKELIATLGLKTLQLKDSKHVHLHATLHELTIHLGVGLRKSMHNIIRQELRTKFEAYKNPGYKNEYDGKFSAGVAGSGGNFKAVGAKVELGLSFTEVTEDSGEFKESYTGTTGLIIQAGDEKIASISFGLHGSLEKGTAFENYGDFIEEKVLEAFDKKFGPNQYQKLLGKHDSLQKHLIMNKVFGASDRLMIPEKPQSKGFDLTNASAKTSLKGEVAKYVTDISLTGEVATTRTTYKKNISMLDVLEKNPAFLKEFKHKTRIPHEKKVLNEADSEAFFQKLEQGLKGRDPKKIKAVNTEAYQAIKDLQIDFNNFCRCHRERKKDEAKNQATKQIKDNYGSHSTESFFESAIVTFHRLKTIHQASLPKNTPLDFQQKVHLYNIGEFQKDLSHPHILDKHVSPDFKRVIKGDKFEAGLEFEFKLDKYVDLGGKITYANVTNALKSDDNGESVAVEITLRGNSTVAGVFGLLSKNASKFSFLSKLPQLQKADLQENLKTVLTGFAGGVPGFQNSVAQSGLQLTFNFGKSGDTYAFEYLRLSSSEGIKFTSPEFSATPAPGVSVNAQGEVSHQKIITIHEVLGSETLGYVQAKFNQMRQQDPTHFKKEWSTFLKNHESEFGKMFANFAAKKSPLWQELKLSKSFTNLDRQSLVHTMSQFKSNNDKQAESKHFKAAGDALFNYLNNYYNEVYLVEDQPKTAYKEKSGIEKKVDGVRHYFEK